MAADTDRLLKVHIDKGQKDEAEMVGHHLKKDNDEQLRQLIDDWGIDKVMRPKPETPTADTATSLHKTVRNGAIKCLKRLLEFKLPEKDLEACDMYGQTALLNAVVHGQRAALEQLLHAGANINARGEDRLGALHLLVRELCSSTRKVDQRRDLMNVADLLFSDNHVQKLDLEPHANVNGLTNATPLTVAVVKLQRGPQEPWEESLRQLCRKLVMVGASLEGSVGGITVRKVIIEKNWVTHEELQQWQQQQQQQPRVRPLAAHVADEILMGGRNVSTVLQGQKKGDARKAVNSWVTSHRMLYYAVYINNTSLMETLLEYGADPWKAELINELPLHCAAAYGHFNIFKRLLEKMKGESEIVNLEQHTVSLVQKIMESTRLKDRREDRDPMACFRRLLEKDVVIDLNQEGRNKMTALHIAAAFNNQDMVKEMLQAGAFLGARHKESQKKHKTALNKIHPTTLERAMDSCITHLATDGNTDENIVSDTHTLNLDFRFLVPPRQTLTTKESKPENEMNTLMHINRSSRHRHVIKHPLIQILLYAKWRKAKFFHRINVGIYLVFVIVLTLFVYFLKDLLLMEQQLIDLKNATLMADEENHQSSNASITKLETDIANQSISVNVLITFLVLGCVYIAVREIFQFKYSDKYRYFKNIENSLVWILIIIVAVLCFLPLELDYMRHFAAWAMIVAWWAFMMVLGREPLFALYISMLREVSANFVKMILLFSALIIAFAISFNIILHPSEEEQAFATIWTSIPKVFVMSTGEFDYGNLTSTFPHTLIVISAILVFMMFIFLIFLVMVNVLNALAVTDTQKVIEDSKFRYLTSRLELVYMVENILLRCTCVKNMQLLSGIGKTPTLKVKMNNPKKNERLILSDGTECELGKDARNALRLHRYQHLESTKEGQGSIGQLLTAVENLISQRADLKPSPDSLAAALQGEN